MWRAMQLANLLLGDETISGVLESSVHRPKRGRIWIATFTGPKGGQVWRSTGLTDRDQALLVAKRWEAEARAERLRSGRTIRKPIARVHRDSDAQPGLFSQREVALALGISERAVRRIERRAVEKLKRHPALQEIWQKYLSGELIESESRLTPQEVRALFGLVRTREEQLLVEKILRLIQRQ